MIKGEIIHLLSSFSKGDLWKYKSNGCTYSNHGTALVISIIGLFIYPFEIGIVESFKKLNWASFVLGLSIIGLELGFLLAYRSGWNISLAGLYANRNAPPEDVEIQWDFDKNIKKYRFETFCYGPKSCKFYKMGRPRSVPYKNRGSAIDDGWLDEICTEGRDKED